MKLSQRISLLSVLPATGKFTDLIIVEDIKKKINITQDEISKFKIETTIEGNKFRTIWNTDGEKSFLNITFTESEHNMLKKVFVKMDEDGLLTSDLLDLYERFVNNPFSKKTKK